MSLLQLQTDLKCTPSQAKDLLSTWLGAPVRCTRIRRLHGGMVNTVLGLEFDRAPYRAVLKLHAAGSDDFAREAQALEHLHAYTQFPCPQVYWQDSSTSRLPHAFLLLEQLPGVCLEGLPLAPSERANLEAQLAELLLELHSHRRAAYGPIAGPGQPSWAAAFLPRLLEARSYPGVAQRLPPQVLAQVEAAIQLAPAALQQAGPPTLIHGDLWDGNLVVRPVNGGWHLVGILDPALEYADVEAELAYLEVFDTPRQAFFSAYCSSQPLRPGYETRRLFYWLQTGLLHVGLFGEAAYCEFTARTAAAICRLETPSHDRRP
jgi:fructosamine-3-kinase